MSTTTPKWEIISCLFFSAEKTYFSFREKRKVGKRKAGERLTAQWAVQRSRDCAHISHARKVFEVGFGEGLFSKSPSPITKLGSRFRGNDRERYGNNKFLLLAFLRKQGATFFSFREKGKVGKRKAGERLTAQWVVQRSRDCAHIPHTRKVFEVGFGEELFSKSPSPKRTNLSLDKDKKILKYQ